MSDESNTAKEDDHTKEKDAAPLKEVKVTEAETATNLKEAKHAKKEDKETEADDENGADSTVAAASTATTSSPEKFTDYVKELHKYIIKFVIDGGGEKQLAKVIKLLSGPVVLADAPPLPQSEPKSITEVVQKYNNPIVPGLVREVTPDEIVNTRCIHNKKCSKKPEQSRRSRHSEHKDKKKEKDKKTKPKKHEKEEKAAGEAREEEGKKEEEEAEAEAEEAEGEEEMSGLTAMHLAVRSRSTDLVNVLLTKGGDLTVKSGHGWNSLQEAAADGWQEGLELMLPALQTYEQQQFAQMYPLYCEYLEGLPDFVMEIEWEIKSWLVPLAKYLCPHDKYVINKKGASLRIDMNMSELIPALKASGNCSLFFFGENSPTPGNILWVSWENKKKMYLFSRTKHVRIGDVKVAAKSYITHPVSRLLKPKDALDPTFTDAKSVFGKLKKEKIGEWDAKQVVIKNVALAAVTREGSKETIKEREKRKRAAESVDDDDDDDDEVTVTSSNEDGVIGKSGSSRFVPCACCPKKLKAKCSASPIKITTKIKKYEGTAWLSDKFPRSFKDFSPIFRIIGSSQKQVLSLETFMNTLLKDQPNLFPVKFNVPILPTFSVTVTFKSYEETDKIDPALFKIPSDVK